MSFVRKTFAPIREVLLYSHGSHVYYRIVNVYHLILVSTTSEVSFVVSDEVVLLVSVRM